MRMQDVPVADAKPEDIQELLGGALFKALYKWMMETGPVYLLPTGEHSPGACWKICFCSHLLFAQTAPCARHLERRHNTARIVCQSALYVTVLLGKKERAFLHVQVLSQASW
jgi:hypothetical protein